MSTTQVMSVRSRARFQGTIRVKTDVPIETLFCKYTVQSPTTIYEKTFAGCDEAYLDQENLLECCDAVRASLRESKTLGAKFEKVTTFLEAALKDEFKPLPRLDFATIKYARLDKLLTEILDPANRPTPVPLRFRADMATANNLQRMWSARFRQPYASLDQLRGRSLPRSRLKDVYFCPARSDRLEPWAARTTLCERTPEMGGDAQFEPGLWWLTLACAYRDGIVGSERERPTRGTYGGAALPLLTGREECVGENTVKYVREGRMSDMHASLISQVGTHIRILRGYRLKSEHAPKAGVRYDGLYTIRRYGTKLDVTTEKYRLELILERVSGQRDLAEIMLVPRPSQLDDWRIFERMEGEMTRQRRGEQVFQEWYTQKEEERIDREHWKRARMFDSLLEKGKEQET